MAQGPTNVNLIATYIHNNPGCRRVDLKRMLHKATTGRDADKQYHLYCKNQYFQRYANNGNRYLDRLWYNELDRRKYTRKSSYHLTRDGRDKVCHDPMIRPFEPGSIVEWQYNSPNNIKHGWQPRMQGLVVERTDLYGLWVMPIGDSTREDGKLIYVSHQAYVRSIDVR
jgi:archaellin